MTSHKRQVRLVLLFYSPPLQHPHYRSENGDTNKNVNRNVQIFHIAIISKLSELLHLLQRYDVHTFGPAEGGVLVVLVSV
jgi:hypothetical protein